MKAELIDVMGSDLTVVNAARVSFQKESSWEVYEYQCGDKCCYEYEENLSEKDQKLISYLAKHNHWTPFSHAMVTMREKVPIFVARQRFKHMVGFTYNEVSRRYVDDPPEFFYPEEWRLRAENAKQGSSDDVLEGRIAFDINSDYQKHMVDLLDLYFRMLDSGIAPEQARMVLPQSMYTEYYVTGSLAAWARAYKLRIDAHAQKEIQDLAIQWGEIIEPLFPVSWKALTSD